MSLQIAPQSSVFICPTPLDFRNGFNGTEAACRLRIGQNPMYGGVFVFINLSKTMIRIYYFDGHGEWLITKRVASGRFFWWNESDKPSNIMAEHIYLLLRGGDPKSVKLPTPWKKMDQGQML